jgi:hypothetical protein
MRTRGASSGTRPPSYSPFLVLPGRSVDVPTSAGPASADPAVHSGLVRRNMNLWGTPCTTYCNLGSGGLNPNGVWFRATLYLAGLLMLSVLAFRLL